MTEGDSYNIIGYDVDEDLKIIIYPDCPAEFTVLAIDRKAGLWHFWDAETKTEYWVPSHQVVAITKRAAAPKRRRRKKP